MNNTRLLQCFSCLLIIVGFFGCADHRIPAVSPGASRLRVKMITQEGPNGTSKVSAFKYDAQGRLRLINVYQTPDSTVAPTEKSVYQYDAQNRLTQLRRDIVIPGQSNAYEEYQYTYNPAGQVFNIHYSNSNPGSFFDLFLSYTDANYLKGSAKVFNFLPISYNRSQTYTFTGNNLTTASSILNFPAFGAFGNTVTATYSYDTNVNPFYGVYVIPSPFTGTLPSLLAGSGFEIYTYYGGIDNLFNLSQNNVLSTVTSTGITTIYAYTYNAANLPTKRVTASGNSVLETLYFEYQNY